MKKDKLPLVTAVSSFDAVVLCDGDYPSHAVALSILQHAKYRCAAMVQVSITFCTAGHLMLLWEMAIRCLMTSRDAMPTWCIWWTNRMTTIRRRPRDFV